MGLARLSRPSSPKTKPATPNLNKDAEKSFDFLSLPKDIRLMVYEELGMKTYRDKFPIRDTEHHVTLVNTVIPGVSIMATCHQIRAEASPIILPWLRKILCSPPIITIRAEHIVSLLNMRDGYTPWGRKSIMERLIVLLRSSWTVPRITRYRRGRLTAKQLWKKFCLQQIIAAEDETSLNALVRFMLRIAKYIASNPDSGLKCPPALSLVLEIPDNFASFPVTTSTSRMKCLTYKCLSPLDSTPPRTVTSQADVTWLVRRFTYRLAIMCQFWGSFSLVVKFRYVTITRTRWVVSGKTVQRAIMLGLEQAKNKEPYVVSFGGAVTEKTFGEV
ncbi:uncharacterized protein yc1106_05925 [Curvularia clavata]|uniref:Uncharacterized protein n=1 Tax=Curvularia clavata TaxID=95742 RepID=A0A9Q9DUQ2_CURCL|nr:uncharacterized protein yc1106_05925 [Curvularia clavata]